MLLPTENDFQELFESSPGLYLILKPDLIIVAASNAYLEATMTEREQITGRYLFDVFPDNPGDPNATVVSNLRASLAAVLQYNRPHTMAIQQYDIRRPDGTFEERFWSPLNKPVLSPEGEVRYIIHSLVDVTQQQKSNLRLKEADDEIRDLYHNAPCGYFSVDLNIYLTNVNQTL